MAKFTETQPKEGERVFLCTHTAAEKGPEPKEIHFFRVPEGESLKAVRPDGSTTIGYWIAICGDCMKLHKGDPFPCITGDAVWKGNEPFVEENESKA